MYPFVGDAIPVTQLPTMVTIGCCETNVVPNIALCNLLVEAEKTKKEKTDINF